MAAKTKRQKFSIVDRSLQYRFIALILVYSMIIVGYLAIFLFVPDFRDMMNEDLSLEVRAAAAQRALGLHSRVWPGIIALVCVLGLHSMRIFHRVVGPLYRFRWAFGEIKKGDLSFRVKLRKKDYLHWEEGVFNEMMDVLDEKWGNIRMTVPYALKSLDALEQSVAELSGWRDSDQQLLQKHRQHLEALSDHAQYFRLKEEQKQGQDTAEQ